MVPIVKGTGLQPSCREEKGRECRHQEPQEPERGRLPGRGMEEAYLKEEETWCGSEIGNVGPSGQQVEQEQ